MELRDESGKAAAVPHLPPPPRPIDDVRGSAEFRRTLAANLLMKFYYESSAQPQSVAATFA